MEYDSQWVAIVSVAEKIGCSAETLRHWVRQAEHDSGRSPGLTTEERARLKELECENRELRRANEILPRAAAFSPRRRSTANRSRGGLHRPPPRGVRSRADRLQATGRVRGGILPPPSRPPGRGGTQLAIRPKIQGRFTRPDFTITPMKNRTPVPEADAVRRAVDALFQSPDLEPAVEPETRVLARVAVERLAELFAGAPGVFLDVLEGARAGAEVLSSDRLQGLSEIVQNADDAAATWVRFHLEPDALWVAHNGKPVRLPDVLALSLPWLTTKRANPQVVGRFGIGLMTLQALSRVLEVYSGPYAIHLEAPSLAWVDPVPEEANSRTTVGETVLRIPLGPGALEVDEVVEWLDRWDDSALLFCRHVRVLHFQAGEEVLRTRTLVWTEADSVEAVVQGQSVSVRRRHARAQDGRTWIVDAADVAAPPAVQRSRKAHAETMPLGVALPLFENDRGMVYAGLPLLQTSVPGRFHAQFDPTSNRQDLAATPWNRVLLPYLADFWENAVLRLFTDAPDRAWEVVPLPRGSVGHALQLERLEAMLLERARGAFPARARISVHERALTLTELAVEVPQLTGVISDTEIARLAQQPAALPHAARDSAGRWRTVLLDWRAAGAPIPQAVSVEAALDLFHDFERDPTDAVRLAAVAIEAGLGERVARLPSVVLEDGSRTAPPTTGQAWILVEHAGGLGRLLGIARSLHPAYRADSSAALAVRGWLSQSGAMPTVSNDAAILRRLAAAGSAGQALDNVLSDEQVRALRDAFEVLPAESRSPLGQQVGRAIRLHAFQYDDHGRRQELKVSPAEAYLSQRIERERESFAIAAHRSPGLIWLHHRYAQVLQSSQGRAGLGPSRFLRLLGAETAPRLEPHPNLVERYAIEREKGLSCWMASSPETRTETMRGMNATYTLEDAYNPDLDAVLLSIARDHRARRRRARAVAMIETLGRAWMRLGEQATVTAADEHYGWVRRGEIRAFWVWRAASIPWLDDAKGTPRPPARLRLRTTGTLAVHGPEAEGYLHADLHDRRPEVLAAIGVAGDPNTGELVARLREIRDRVASGEDTAAEAAAIYRALADRLGGGTHLPGDLSQSELLAAFNEPPGLIRTEFGWKRPADVLSGSPIFGRWQAFVPSLQEMRRLWTTLRVRPPTVADCVSVLEEMARARKQPDPEDVGVMLDSLRFLTSNREKIEAGTDLERRLGRLPLWTSRGWYRRRPVYRVNDLPLADGLGAVIPVWQPGGEAAQFAELMPLLRLKEIAADAARVVDAGAAVMDDGATATFRAAVGLLKDDLVRNDPIVAARLQAEWDRLGHFEVRVAPTLRVRVEGLREAEGLTIDVTATVDRAAGVLYLRDVRDLARVAGGGRALASLFRSDPRRLAQAWLAACMEAEAGREAAAIRLAEERAAADQAALRAQMEAFRLRVAQGLANGARPSGPPLKNGPAGSSPEVTPVPSALPSPPRVLIDPSRFHVIDPQGTLANADGPTGKKPARPQGDARPLAIPKPEGPAPRPPSAPPSYSDAEREAVGLELLRRLLASDAEGVRDLRAQRGVGADAMDLDQRLYELKVHAGAEPDQITMEASQVRRALDPNFFLVIVSNVEVGDAPPTVRIILNPLSQLTVTDRGSIQLTGVHGAQSLVYPFTNEESGEMGGQDAEYR